jgi:hypothetical protein
MGKLVIIALFTAGFAIGAAYVTAFEVMPVRAACITASCYLHIAGG